MQPNTRSRETCSDWASCAHHPARLTVVSNGIVVGLEFSATALSKSIRGELLVASLSIKLSGRGQQSQGGESGNGIIQRRSPREALFWWYAPTDGSSSEAAKLRVIRDLVGQGRTLDHNGHQVNAPFEVHPRFQFLRQRRLHLRY